MIPKTFHFIWVGDESRRPDNCIKTWIDAHPDWEIRLWGNEELDGVEWHNARHIAEMRQREWNGVADMMRWEILHALGGVVFDADSICLRPLDDHLLDCAAFTCWENEIVRPGLLAAGYFGCEAGNPFVARIIEDIAARPSVVDELAWKTVGPLRLTESYRQARYSPLRIYPSHYFIPRHFSGMTYEGSDPVYAEQLWGSTRKAYDAIHKIAVGGETAAGPAAQPAPEAVPEVAPASAAPATRSPLEKVHAPYFLQKLEVGSEIAHLGRLDVLAGLCAGKRVLHVGCADWPITDPRTSLHVRLDAHCARLDGLDIHAEALEQLAPHVKGSLFTSFDEVTDPYDVVLVPEVLEHVPDVEGFLAQLEAVDASCYLISVPDAFQCRQRHFDYIAEDGTFLEAVHPDHNVWYTPYTFANTIRKYSGLHLDRMWFFNRISLLALLSKRPEEALAA
ncbi:glycosyltransferase [Novosphingobium album (ex Liu et al. 2023)]|uniref:Glycosyltransferase n=1 Tax=Novosphingobium album (ex Liu et al. 2023) TaxID=3031130 RepID=A0ABT5WXF8_9SPHN|nr:glycosyltransferase [Novosphingobium album (ex Liu et al. 2023)]MDE8654590.1 glycosyltransferase [Novosphingobium album (ex Liu et al. 2023)]